MKKNIVVVSLNNYLAKEVCLVLSQHLEMNFIDVDAHIEKELLLNKGDSLSNAEDYLTKLERNYIQKLTSKTNSIFSIDAETYLANNHIDYFRECDVVYLQTKIHSIDLKQIKNKAERTRIEQNTSIHENLNDFLTSSSEFIIENSDVKDINEIINEIEQVIASKE